MSSAIPPIIQVEHLHWSVEATKGGRSSAPRAILKDLSFAINSGATVGIVGPNGAGKTSLLRCLLGLIEDYSGSILIQGKEQKQMSRRMLAKTLSSVPQHSDSLFDLRVLDVVQMGLLPHKSLFEMNSTQDARMIEQALHRVGMESKQNQLLNTLSGGELQRVLVARALVQKADILVLDEPTNHLDVYFQHQILQLLRHLNLTILMTIHDLNLAARYCDQILLLADGQIQGFGTPSEVLQAEVLSQIFGLPCAVDMASNGLVSVCFHPDDSLWEQSR
ncbi:ABC transporter ATP-binding protein [Paraneptunicella aestuarii]|uniref:ABC transporter ATP-binding protein n=1 Tax=Paraneptunicella aestuarii TaxID=2831148 RepID=UPI001E5A9FF6|nr:ABC transporter ATP-binding protein [Paraneptunicella aestuarii]